MSIHKSAEKSLASQALDDEFGILLRQNMNGFVDRDLAERLAAFAEIANPPSNNMGGTYPPPPLFFPHGEKSSDFVVKNKTKIDWLAFTSVASVEALQLVLAVVWPGVVFSRNSHGMPGYPDSDAVLVEGVQYGLMGYGAKHGRNFVSLTGTACKTLTDELVSVFHDALSLDEVDATLSRIDLCLDFYRGERTYDHARAAYDKLGFRRPRANADPELKEVGTTKGGINLGRTMYVGKRDGHVMARIYEKGLEVFAKLPEDQRAMSENREFERLLGTPPGAELQPAFVADDWLRLEVEYKKQGKDLPLPLSMMLRRDEFFAGAYPYFADALGVADGVRPAALKSDFQVELVSMISHAKRSYGSLIHSLRELGFTDSDVVQYLTTGRNNEKLVRSGLLARLAGDVRRWRDDNPDWDVPF